MASANADEQSQEIEVLQSIYEDDVQLDLSYDDPEGARCFVVSVPGPHAIRLRVHLPLGYPSHDAPIGQVTESFGLTNSQRDEIIDDLASIFGRSSGQVCLYEWIESVRERYATSSWEGDSAELDTEATHSADKLLAEAIEIPFVSDPQTLRPRVRTAQANRDPEREARLLPLIYHGEPLTDRKSTFQAHSCPVFSVEDVRSFLALLLDDRKVERAIHNMLAYRIVGDFTVKDNDEDGEDGAGSIMSHLLELTHAENLAVVVTRWYGGIHLGPDRFKHINRVAREAVEAIRMPLNGAAPKQNQKKKGRK